MKTSNPAIPLLKIYSREMEAYVHIKTWTQMFIATLVKNRIKPKCPPVVEC